MFKSKRATPTDRDPVTPERLGEEFRDALPKVRLHSISVHNHECDALWLSEGALGPDEHSAALEAMGTLGLENTRQYAESNFGDGRSAAFFPVRSPYNELLGLVMVIADSKIVDKGQGARLGTPEVRAILQRLAVLLRPPTAAETQPIEKPVFATATGAPAATASGSASVARPSSSVPPAPPPVARAVSATAAAAVEAEIDAALLAVEFDATPAPAALAPTWRAPEEPQPTLTATQREEASFVPVIDSPRPDAERVDMSLIEFSFDALLSSGEEAEPPAIAAPLPIERKPAAAVKPAPKAVPEAKATPAPKPAATAKTAASTSATAPKTPAVRPPAPPRVMPPPAARAPATPAASAPAAAAPAASAAAKPAQAAPLAMPAPPPHAPRAAAKPAMPPKAAPAKAPPAKPAAAAAPDDDSTPVLALPVEGPRGPAYPAAEATLCIPATTVREVALHVQQLHKLRSGGRTRRYEVLLRSRSHPEHEGMHEAVAAMLASQGATSTMDRYITGELLAWLGQHPEVWEREPSSFSVNLALATLTDEQFLPFVSNNLADAHVSAEIIGFEVPERAFIDHRAHAERFVKRCEELGCYIVIDDFSMHSDALPFLASPAVRLVKVDSRLTTAALKDKLPQAVVIAISQAAKVLGVHCVAKRVDTQVARQWLSAIGIDFAQGYLLEKPQPLDDLAEVSPAEGSRPMSAR